MMGASSTVCTTTLAKGGVDVVEPRYRWTRWGFVASWSKIGNDRPLPHRMSLVLDDFNHSLLIITISCGLALVYENIIHELFRVEVVVISVFEIFDLTKLT